MAGDQIKRFERWRKTLPENTAYLVGLVVDELVPAFRAQGFDRFADYAGGSGAVVGANCLPLQRRTGAAWPTVEIDFNKRGAPLLGVHFAVLPPVCCRRKTDGTTVEIPRTEASVIDGPAFFSLCRGGGGSNDRNFGYRYFALSPKQTLSGEIAVLKSLLPWLFGALERIPEEWLKRPTGYVDPHAFLSPVSHIFGVGECAEKMRAASAGQ